MLWGRQRGLYFSFHLRFDLRTRQQLLTIVPHIGVRDNSLTHPPPLFCHSAPRWQFLITSYTYISGPVASTFGDFWRTVWDQGVCIIVMVTNMVEGGRVG